MKKVSKLVLAAFVAMLFLSACEPKKQKIYIVSTNELMLEYLAEHPEIDYGKTNRVKEK